MSSATYLQTEVLRSFRNRRFLVLSLAFPIVLYLAITAPNRHHTFDGAAFPLYFMTGMATLCAMSAVISAGAVISAERSVGWTRQLRLTPLTTRGYFGAKLACGFLRALFTLVLLGLAGTAFGVRLSAGAWLTVLGLLVVGLVPFAVLGLLVGHLLRADSMAVAVGGIVTLFSLLGGAYAFLLATSGPFFQVIKAIPSYWLVQAGRAAHGGGGWPAEGWLVVAAWTAVLVPLAVLAYRRDTART
jgi:ABC-2 type transport system permease protein